MFKSLLAPCQAPTFHTYKPLRVARCFRFDAGVTGQGANYTAFGQKANPTNENFYRALPLAPLYINDIFELAQLRHDSREGIVIINLN